MLKKMQIKMYFKSMVINMSNSKPAPKPNGKPIRTEPGAVKPGTQKPKP